MKPAARVAALFIARAHRQPMTAMQQVTAVADRGIEGCAHGRHGSRRQVLIVDRETLTDLGLEPGMLRENITATGLNTAEMKPGDRVEIGESLLEATIPCEPCYRMDEIRIGLQAALKDRRGMLFRVITGGNISCGDGIQRVPADTLISSTGGKVD